MDLFNWRSPIAIKKEREEKIKQLEEEKIKQLEIVLNDYVNELISKPLTLVLSSDGFPRCPVCNEEFKDLEEIIKHLNKKKTEFYKLSIATREYAKEPKIKIKGYDKSLHMSSFVSRSYVSEYFEDLGKEYNRIETEFKKYVDRGIRQIKLFREVEERKHKDWKEVKKAKPRENSLSPKVRFEVLKRDHFTCQYCGRKSPEVELEIDHIEPYSKTKDNSMENLITACKDCNRGKKADAFMIQE